MDDTINFKFDARNIVDFVVDNIDDIRINDEFAVEDINNTIIDILKDDERYEKLLKANGRILKIIDKIRDSSKLWTEYKELND